MATLASRIQERANQFIAEQAKLQSLQANLHFAVCVEQEEIERNAQCHRRLLEVSHNRFGIERDVCETNDMIEDCNESLLSLRSDTQGLEESARTVCAKIEQAITKVYAPHDAKTAIYCQALDSAIAKRKREIAEIDERDEKTRFRIALLRIQEEQFRREILQLEDDIKRMRQEEIIGDNAITSLAEQVQESLSKVRKSVASSWASLLRSFSDNVTSTMHFSLIMLLQQYIHQRIALRKSLTQTLHDSPSSGEDESISMC